MKLVIISAMSGFPWGGSEELWFRTALYAAGKGDQVEVWHYDWKEHTSDKIQVLLNKGINVNLVDLQDRHKSVSLLKRIFQKLKLYKEKELNPYERVWEIKPDVVLISQGDTFGLLENRALLHLVDSLHTKCYILNQYNFEHLILNSFQIQTASEIFNKVRKILFVSHRNLEAAQHQIALTIERSTVVQNPVNLTSKHILAFPKKQTIHFASVARLDCKFKGQDLLLAAFSNPFWRDKDWTLNLYGLGPDLSYLQQLAHYYLLGERVCFKGHVQDITSVWQENHIQVLCSFGEGTPLSLMEAFFCGRPVIATDVGGNAKYVIEEKTGFVIDAPTIKLISVALIKAYNNFSSWEEMGINAHKLASHEFSIEAEQQLYDLITKV